MTEPREALHNTTDARAWATEFMRLFPNGCNDEGTMLGWFANAIETGRAVGALARSEGPGLDALRQLSEAATPGRWYVDGPEFGGMWVCVGHGDAQKSGAVHPSATGQPYAVLAGMGEADADLIVAAVNYVRLALAAQDNPA